MGEMCDGERGLIRVQYVLEENEQGYRGCLKAQISTWRSVKVKQSSKRGNILLSEGCVLIKNTDGR